MNPDETWAMIDKLTDFIPDVPIQGVGQPDTAFGKLNSIPTVPAPPNPVSWAVQANTVYASNVQNLSAKFVMYDTTSNHTPSQKEASMLAKIMKMYTMGLAQQEFGVVPHIVGPPGCGKSTIVKQAADLLEVNCYTMNVSRINPLNLAGISMPNADNTELNLLHAPFWKQLKDGDIVLLDEFLRGFPEVYNALLDIITSREVDGFHLPNVFIIAASNSVRTYDAALEDRLIHLPVSDPRKHSNERLRLQQMFVDAAGLAPSMTQSQEMGELFTEEVLPTFALLDSFKGDATNLQRDPRTAGTKQKGKSMRNLLGQLRLREVRTDRLRALMNANNKECLKLGTPQYMVVIPSGKIDPKIKTELTALRESKKELTPLQVRNLDLNLQLIELEDTLKENMEDTDDDIFIDDIR